MVADGHVRCPWHGACFNLATGDIEEYPCHDAITRFELRTGGDGDELTLCATRAQLKQKRRAVDAVSIDATNKKVAVIVGAGAAGGTCAESLRQHGFTGRIVLVGNEAHLPYDRTKLSKALTDDAARLQWRTREYYSKLAIELCLNTTVVACDVNAKRLTLRSADGSSSNNNNNNNNDDDTTTTTTTLAFDYCVLATGGTPRSLPCPGFGLRRVMQLRTPRDAGAIGASVDASCVCWVFRNCSSCVLFSFVLCKKFIYYYSYFLQIRE